MSRIDKKGNAMSICNRLEVRSARTTNLIERSFEEERRRTKVIPRLLDEKSAMKLVFATRHPALRTVKAAA